MGIMMDEFLFGDRSILALLVFPDTLYSSFFFFNSSFVVIFYLFDFIYFIIFLIYHILFGSSSLY
ncbi:hypothetical protein F5Y03DRAFT_161089 [Xylaria venustula]|nr:hypothetical protein F5Y03DRAFT_161089 [Xylaria venustula]